MKLKKYIFACLLLLVGLVGCYKEDDLNVELGVDNITPVDSEDPVDHYIYEFYQNYETVISYEYDSLDYQLEFTSLKEVTFVAPTDREVLSNGLSYLNEIFGGLYSDDFKKNFFPPKIFLVDSITSVDDDDEKIENLNAFHGSSYVALGEIRDGVEAYSDEVLAEAKIGVNMALWTGYLASNAKFVLPSTFAEVSDGFYEKTLTALEIDDVKEAGFWEGEYRWGGPWWNPVLETFTPENVDEDIQQFLTKIMSLTEAELLAEMEGYPLLEAKYFIIKNYIEDEFDFDIHDIGGH